MISSKTTAIEDKPLLPPLSTRPEEEFGAYPRSQIATSAARGLRAPLPDEGRQRQDQPRGQQSRDLSPPRRRGRTGQRCAF